MESGVHPTRETQPEHKGEKSPHRCHIPAQDSLHIPEVREALWAQAQAQTTLARMAAWPTGSSCHRPVRCSTDPITHRGCGASPGDPSPAWMRPGGPFPAFGAEGGTARRYPTRSGARPYPVGEQPGGRRGRAHPVPAGPPARPGRRPPRRRSARSPHRSRCPRSHSPAGPERRRPGPPRRQRPQMRKRSRSRRP